MKNKKLILYWFSCTWYNLKASFYSYILVNHSLTAHSHSLSLGTDWKGKKCTWQVNEPGRCKWINHKPIKIESIWFVHLLILPVHSFPFQGLFPNSEKCIVHCSWGCQVDTQDMFSKLVYCQALRVNICYLQLHLFLHQSCSIILGPCTIAW